MEKMANSKLMWDFLKGSVTAKPTTHTPQPGSNQVTRRKLWSPVYRSQESFR